VDTYESALFRLRGIRDAVQALDLDAAGRLLAEQDAALRAALLARPPLLAVSEAEALHLAQAELLAQLEAVQRGVAAESQQARRGGAAARAYLGHAGG